MINNYICENCDKEIVCSWRDVLNKFNDENKKYIPVVIEIKQCPEFKEVGTSQAGD